VGWAGSWVYCGKGRVLSLLDQVHPLHIHTNRFGVIPKGTTGRWRLIVVMSFQERGGALVNEGVTKLSVVRGVQDMVRGIVRMGRGTVMAKVDVKSAYRNILVHPDDRQLMGTRRRGALFVDTVL